MPLRVLHPWLRARSAANALMAACACVWVFFKQEFSVSEFSVALMDGTAYGQVVLRDPLVLLHQ